MSEIFSRVPKGQGLQGFQEIEGLPLLAGAFKKFGVSKSKGFQGKYTPNMNLVKNIIASAWGSPACDLPPLWGNLVHLESAHHGAKIFSSMGIIVR